MSCAWAKPQSVPAITFSRPTSLANVTMRSATSARVLDGRGVMRDDARDQDLAGRQLDLLPHVPLVLVAHVGRFDGIGAGAHLAGSDRRCPRAARRRHAARASCRSRRDSGCDPRDALQRVIERVDRAAPPIRDSAAGSARRDGRTCSRARHRRPAARNRPCGPRDTPRAAPSRSRTHSRARSHSARWRRRSRRSPARPR